MNDKTPPETRSAKLFLLLVALWIPLGFFIWFFLAAIFVAPVYLATKALYGWLLPDLFSDLAVTRYVFTISTGIQQALSGGARGVVELTINPMIYGYGLPLLGALVAATPLTWKSRCLQLTVGYVAVVLTQIWGTVWESLKLVAFDTGPAGRAMVDALAVSPSAIAIAYQLGALILPALVPVLVWVSLNRRFIERFVRG